MKRQDSAESDKDAGSSKVEEALKKRRSQRSFPASTFEEPLEFAREIFRIGGGQPVKRLTLFDQLGKSLESGGSRQLIVNSGRYGLTKGGVQAENIELTSAGQRAVDEQVLARERIRTWAELSIAGIDPFQRLFERFVSNNCQRMPY